MPTLVERLREWVWIEPAHDYDPEERHHPALLDEAANRIELLEGALKTAHDVFAGEIEGLHKIIEMNQPGYKRTIVASIHEGTADRYEYVCPKCHRSGPSRELLCQCVERVVVEDEVDTLIRAVSAPK